MKIASPKCLAAIFLWLLASGCEIENSNRVDCAEKDCQASCLESGFLGGTCTAGGKCACTAGEQGPYAWDDPAANPDGGDGTPVTDVDLPSPGLDGGVDSGVTAD